MIAELLADALEAKGFPREAVSMIESTDREATGELMKLRGIVDVLIPRGGAGLIQRCVRESLVPVIETGTGNCHIYVHESADFDKALNIIVNAKTQRVGVCNAAESLLVDRAVAARFCLRSLPCCTTTACSFTATRPRAPRAPTPALWRAMTTSPRLRRTGVASTWRSR